MICLEVIGDMAMPVAFKCASVFLILATLASGLSPAIAAILPHPLVLIGAAYAIAYAVTELSEVLNGIKNGK